MGFCCANKADFNQFGGLDCREIFMAQVSSSGIASGLDINSIVKQLVLVERKPIDVAQRKQIAIAAKLSAFSALSASFSNLKSTLSPLRLFSSFQSKAASSTESSVVAVAVNDSQSSVVGSSTISQVTSLARAQKLASAPFASATASVGTGKITVKVGSGVETAITIDITHSSLTQIRDKINTANAGVTASVLKSNDKEYKLVLQSAKSGVENTLQVVITDDDANSTDASGFSLLADLTEIQSAKDAQFLLDGATITRSSNTITDAIDGLTITLLKKTQGDEEVTINVDPNTTTIKGNIDTFVAAYNEVIKALTVAQTFDPTKKGGPLLGNPAAQTITKLFRLLPKERVPDLEGLFGSLSDIGITAQSDGTLTVASAKLNTALGKDPLAVGRVFSVVDKKADPTVVTPTSGIADRVFKAISELLDMKTGRLSSEQKGLRAVNATIDKEVTRLEKHVSDFEKRTRDKFSKLEGVLSGIQGVGSALNRQVTQLENLTSFISRRNSNSNSTSGV